jgi:hypothetical protein
MGTVGGNGEAGINGMGAGMNGLIPSASGLSASGLSASGLSASGRLLQAVVETSNVHDWSDSNSNSRLQQLLEAPHLPKLLQKEDNIVQDDKKENNIKDGKKEGGKKDDGKKEDGKKDDGKKDDGKKEDDKEARKEGASESSNTKEESSNTKEDLESKEKEATPPPPPEISHKPKTPTYNPPPDANFGTHFVGVSMHRNVAISLDDSLHWKQHVKQQTVAELEEDYTWEF